MLSLYPLVLLAAVAAPLGTIADQRDTGMVLRAVRFYRADQDRTRVKGLVQIPLSFLQAPRPGGESSYTVAVRVSDSTGLALHQQSWQSRVTVSGDANAYTVEIVDFAIAPGKYRFEVAVTDSATGKKLSSATELRALSDSTVASDLLIAPEMRLATANDTVPRPGEFRTGNNLVTATARVLLTPLRATVFYLLEAYSEADAEGTISVTIRDSAAKTVMHTQPLAVKVAAGGSVLKGQLDLTGLPPGNYVMVADLQLGGQTIQRSADFSMAGLAETLAKDASRREAERITDEGYFAAMSDDELDAAEAPLSYIAEPRELSAWSSKLSTAAKRRFLTTFWKQRDPTPGPGRNEERESFYAAVDYANRNFKEGGRNTVSGWRSDRGRVYAKNGAPAEVYRKPQQGRAPPYEVWSYTKGRGRGFFYVFADRTGFGAFNLIHTNDLKEVTLPGWAEVLGGPAVADISQFLGVDLTPAGRPL